MDTTSNALVLSSDVLLLVLTWIKTLGIRRTSSRLGMRAPLSTLLLRDGNDSHIESWSIGVLTLSSRGSGTVYFGAILVIQIFAIVSSAVCIIIAVMLFLLTASSCEGRLVLHSLRRLGLFCPSVRASSKALFPCQDHVY